MAQYRFVHVGAAALLAACAVTSVSVVQSVFAGSASASSLVSIVPCRLVDTRADSAIGTRTTPVGPEETVPLAVVGANGECSIPSTATAISANVTVDQPTASSFLTLYPADAQRSHTSNLNWQASSPPVANQVTIGLSTSGAFDVYNNAGTAEVIIDVFGYYEPSSGQAVPGPKGDTGERGLKGDKGDNGDAVLAGLHCTTDQTISWNSTGGAWQCTDPVVDTDTLAALSCTTSQSIRWDGLAWICSSEPIVATLSRVANGFPFFCCDITRAFQAYSPNVDQTQQCDDFQCTIRLVDVLDHSRCQVNFTGNSQSSAVLVTSSTTEITLNYMYRLSPSEPFYVNISCAT
ncbi:MAG: hypothetical protein ABIZ69_01450 [Ilumatobacteraceae bacterium]